ncbi:MAG: hypothetical protein MUC94_05885 [bacterium]|jgi:cobyrinic acid a,c-diamide synthase|nr:hypothetical protein [bacterium]
MVTRKILVNKMLGYLNHRIDLPELIDWAEQAMMNADFEEPYFDDIRDIVAKIGLANVKAFGLTWQDCEDFLQRLGYRARIEVVELA